MGIWWPGAGCWVIARGFSVANRLWHLAKQESVSLHCNELALQSWLGNYLRCSLCLCGEKLEIFYVIMVIHGNFRMTRPFFIYLGLVVWGWLRKCFIFYLLFPHFLLFLPLFPLLSDTFFLTKRSPFAGTLTVFWLVDCCLAFPDCSCHNECRVLLCDLDLGLL